MVITIHNQTKIIHKKINKIHKSKLYLVYSTAINDLKLSNSLFEVTLVDNNCHNHSKINQ